MKITQNNTDYKVNKVVLADGSNRMVKKLFLNTELIYCNYTETEEGSEKVSISNAAYLVEDTTPNQFYLYSNTTNNLSGTCDFIINDIPDGASITILSSDAYISNTYDYSVTFYYDGNNKSGYFSSPPQVNSVSHSLVEGNKIRVSFNVKLGGVRSYPIDAYYVNNAYCAKECKVSVEVKYSVYK
jgi:hypothetical protein